MPACFCLLVPKWELVSLMELDGHRSRACDILCYSEFSYTSYDFDSMKYKFNMNLVFKKNHTWRDLRLKADEKKRHSKFINETNEVSLECSSREKKVSPRFCCMEETSRWKWRWSSCMNEISQIDQFTASVHQEHADSLTDPVILGRHRK